MTHGKRPTRVQKKQIAAAGLNPENWLVCKTYPDRLLLEHRYTSERRMVPK